MKKFQQFLQERVSKDPDFDWIRNPLGPKATPTQNTVPPAEERGSIPVKLSYGAYHIFINYYDGQSDPLYALLSRRGGSVDFVTVFATPEEVARLKEVAKEIMRTSPKMTEVNTAETLLKELS